VPKKVKSLHYKCVALGPTVYVTAIYLEDVFALKDARVERFYVDLPLQVKLKDLNTEYLRKVSSVVPPQLAKLAKLAADKAPPVEKKVEPKMRVIVDGSVVWEGSPETIIVARRNSDGSFANTTFEL
jgi:hypothetical protein